MGYQWLVECRRSLTNIDGLHENVEDEKNEVYKVEDTMCQDVREIYTMNVVDCIIVEVAKCCKIADFQRLQIAEVVSKHCYKSHTVVKWITKG